MEHEEFSKLSKRQKLEIVPNYDFDKIQVCKILFIPINKKMDGWGMSAIFIQDVENKWIRVGDYDCFSFTFWNPTKIQMLRGDFEHDGIVFFMCDQKNKCTYSYGGGFDIGELT